MARDAAVDHQGTPAAPADRVPGEHEDARPSRGRRGAQSGLLRAGRYAWAMVGLLALVVAAGFVAGRLSLVVVPLILALFPAALLQPVSHGLRRVLPPAAAAALTVLGTLALLVAGIALLVPVVAAELPNLGQSFQQGLDDLDGLLDGLPVDVPAPGRLLDRATQQLGGTSGMVGGAVQAATVLVETVAGLLLGLVALFFYLKDGETIARGIGDLLPSRVRPDAAAVAGRVWDTLGSYFRGQMLVALVDAVLIGFGLLLLGVPLALPLAVLVFFGALFPIVGAFVSGGVAVVVALAHGGVGLALVVLAVIVGVQQLEGNVLQPVVLGKAIALHPLMVLVAITAGAVTLGVLGAFLAVPITAGIARSIDYLRGRDPEEPSAEGSQEGEDDTAASMSSSS